MILLAIPNIGPLEGEYLQTCVDTNFVSTVGPFVTRFEKEVAELHGADHAVAVAAGTMGLHAACMVAGVKPGDLVIAPSFTFIASANSIAHSGASPWLIDIDPASWTMSPDALEAALAEDAEQLGSDWIHKPSGRRIAAIMPVYTLGTLPDMDRIGAVARRYGLPVIADAAAAIGVTYKDGPIAPLADLTVFSFNGNKTITTGGGGMVIGNDEALLKRARHITTTARVSRDYEHDEIGWNYRMTNMSAAVGCAQLERLPGFLERKRAIRLRYDAELGDLPGVERFPSPDAAQSTYWFSGVVLTDQARKTVAGLCEALKGHGVEARPFWRPVHLQKPFADAPRADLKHSEALWSRIVTLPCSTGLTEDEQTVVIEAVRAELG
ncbi:MAG: aminotransferase class I/II-fold pyridoxal phosphate-dependent enzyme [Pseudomonadota bacterium]